MVRDEAEQAFREASRTVERIRESSKRPMLIEAPPCDDIYDSHFPDPDSSKELKYLSSADCSKGPPQRAGIAPRLKEDCNGELGPPTFTTTHPKGRTTTTAKALRHSSNQSSDLRDRYTANQPVPTSQAYQTPQTLEPDISRLERAVGLNDHDYSYPQQLWRQRSTRPLTPKHSQALAYMSLSDARPWPMEVFRSEKDAADEPDGEPEPLARIREIEARRATMFSVTDSMAVEVDSSTESSSSDDEEDEKPTKKKKKKKNQANKLQKPSPAAAASLCCVGTGDSCIAKKFWRWARGLPTSSSACSSCRSSISTQLTHEEIGRRIEREVWSWTPESGSLGSPSSSDEELVKDGKEADDWIPAAKQRPPNPHPDHPRWRYFAPRRMRVGFAPPGRVRVVCMPCIEECREEEEREEEEKECMGFEGFEDEDDGYADVQGPEVGVVEMERGDGVLGDEKDLGDSCSSGAETETESVDSDFDLDDAPVQQARSVPIKKVELSDSQKAELERLRREELEREKRDSLEPTLGPGPPPPVPPHREGSLREFQQKRFDFLMGELKALERRREGVSTSV